MRDGLRFRGGRNVGIERGVRLLGGCRSLVFVGKASFARVARLSFERSGSRCQRGGFGISHQRVLWLSD
jgi:hypothetical protein